MKKVLLGILALIYLSASTGATVHLHYCMGRLAEAGLFKQQQDTCSFCGMEKATDGKSCCNDEELVVKISDDQKTTVQSCFYFEQPFTDLNPVQNGFQLRFVELPDHKAPPSNNGPPRSPEVPGYLMNCHFRI
jgi:hypothetical protein